MKVINKIVLIALVIPSIMWSQHTIEGNFSPVEDFTYAFLYKASPTSLDYVDRAQIDAHGNFKITLDASAEAGIYKIVYGQPVDEFNFDLIYNAKEDIELNFSQSEGLVFLSSSENKMWTSYTKSMELVNMTIRNFYAEKSKDEKAFKEIFKTLKDTQTAFEDASDGTFASVFIKANAPYIPKVMEDVNTYASNIKSNYLKHVDFSSTVLQSSDFLKDRVLSYIFSMSSKTDKKYYSEQLNTLVDLMGSVTPEVKKGLLGSIWRQFVAMENAEMSNYMAEVYLKPLAVQTEDAELLTLLSSQQTSAIGAKGQDFKLTTQIKGKLVNTSLHELDSAENYLLIFWSSSCGHCAEALPYIQKMMKKYDSKKIKVIAFGIEEDDVDWKKQIMQFPDFINVIGFDKWDNSTVKAYDIHGTPSYIILDSDKIIRSKPETIRAIETEVRKF